MEYTELKEKIQRGLSSGAIAREFGCSVTNVQYWLRKHGLETIWCRKGPRRCWSCGETDQLKFYKGDRSKCSKCFNAELLKKKHETKDAILREFGNCCRLCGFDKYKSALDFHHLDPTKKDPNFSRKWGWTLDRIKEELKGCVLLCRNCHMAIHAGEAELPQQLEGRASAS